MYIQAYYIDQYIKLSRLSTIIVCRSFWLIRTFQCCNPHFMYSYARLCIFRQVLLRNICPLLLNIPPEILYHNEKSHKIWRCVKSASRVRFHKSCLSDKVILNNSIAFGLSGLKERLSFWK